MRNFLFTVLLSGLLFGQQPTPTTKQAALPPLLSASQTIALRDLEEKRQVLEQQQANIQRQEAFVIAEFAQQHPGWHLAPGTFLPTKDAPSAPASAESTATPKR